MHTRYTYLLTGILLLFFFQCCYIEKTNAQFPQLYFENITTQNGLSNNTVTCLFQDKKGFLWIGTANGLNKFDGNQFQIFYHEEGNKNSLSGNSIVEILEDETGIFWIATKDGGLTKYDPLQIKDKQFTQIKHNRKDTTSIPSDRMTALFDLNKDYLLISSENMSLGFLNKKTLSITYPAIPIDSTANDFLDPAKSVNRITSGNWIHHITADENFIYISFLAGGGRVFIFDRKTYQVKTNTFEIIASSIPFFNVDKNKIWYASWSKGLYMQENYSVDKTGLLKHKKVLDLPDEVTHILSWDENILIASTRNSGIYLLDKTNYEYERVLHKRAYQNSIASNRVICMLKDRNNIWWMGTNEGLSKYNPVQWQFGAEEITDDYSKQITHFSLYDDGNVLRLCTDKGIYKKNNASGPFKLINFLYNGVQIEPTQIYPLENNKYILNTENANYWYYPETEKIKLFEVERYHVFGKDQYYTSSPLNRGSYQIRDMLTDTIEGNAVYLFATLGWGVGIYDLTEKIFYDFIKDSDSSIQNNMTRVLFKDTNKNYWVGTSEGLYKWNKSFPFKNYFEQYLYNENDPNSISGNSVTGIYEDNNHHLWITTNNGLNEFDGTKFYHYKPPFANSKFMYDIYADKKNNLWIAVPGGFEVFNLITKKFKHIDLPNSEWSLKYPAKILQSESGKWLYGSGNYLISFEPDSFYFNNSFPEIYLSDFSVLDESIFDTEAFDKLKFKYNDNFITISFSSLQLSQPELVKYQYQLSGLNKDWIDIDNSGKINFTSLPPGKYELKVKVTNAQGTWSEGKTLTAFTIIPPYWRQWWFYVLCAICAAGIIYAIVRYRENQLMQIQHIRNKIANDLHDDVGSTLSTINLYSEVAKMKSDPDNKYLKTILDKISNTSLEMQENMNHIVWSLQPRNDTFEQMMLRMKSFALENMQAKNVRTEFFIDEKLNDLKLSSDRRKDLFLIYKESIHNIIKYANCTDVKIHFNKNKDAIEMKIEDNGSGFNLKEKFSGNGLHTMKERSKALNGNLHMHSETGKGTTVLLEFPI
ncbi:MAG: hypothetical protein H7Y00_10740 [Fimbriimonadaceae bacterium]|nr:hypothetical protein [Chitinophagales bacterium]